jgi:hypothetical protein
VAEENVGLKDGMAGSSAGRGRSAKTAVLKQASKKARRRQGKRRIIEDR